MGRYRKKPLEVNAISVQEILANSPDTVPLPAWVATAMNRDPETNEGYGSDSLIAIETSDSVEVRTIQGQTVIAEVGEWILQAADNPRDLWAIDGEVFANGYEEVVDAEVVAAEDGGDLDIEALIERLEAVADRERGQLLELAGPLGAAPAGMAIAAVNPLVSGLELGARQAALLLAAISLVDQVTLERDRRD